jgi:hypothetical protein
MNRKEEIAKDLMEILRTVYQIHPLCPPSEKQEQVVQKMVDYLDENISLRRKRKDGEEKECSKEQQSS